MINWIGDWLTSLYLRFPYTSYHGYPNEDRGRYYRYYDITIGARTYQLFSTHRRIPACASWGDQYED